MVYSGDKTHVIYYSTLYNQPSDMLGILCVSESGVYHGIAPKLPC